MSARATPASALLSSDTPAGQLGADLQGIAWGLAPISREDYRLQRMHQYYALEMRREPSIYIGEDLGQPQEVDPLYEAVYMNRGYSCTVQHFQLRHLIWSPDPAHVYFTCTSQALAAAMARSNLANMTDVAMAIGWLDGSTVALWNPTSNHEHKCFGIRDVCGAHSKISTICATADLLLVGGFYGELVVQKVHDYAHYHPLLERGAAERRPPTVVKRITHDDNGITNLIVPFHHTSPEKFLLSSNDAHIRIYDALSHKIIPLYRRTSAVNAAKVSPCGRMLAVATDSRELEIFDLRSDTLVQRLAGHVGFTFSCDWHCDGRLLATGNEDHSTRIYDVRGRTDAALYALGSRMAPVRNVLFSPEGSVLAVMEESDFVIFYDVASGFDRCSTLDFFGETSGISFTPDGDYGYVGCGDAQRGGIIELRRPMAPTLYRLEQLIL